MELLAKTRHLTVRESYLRDKKMPWDLAKEMGDDLPAESSVSITNHNILIHVPRLTNISILRGKLF